MADLTYEITDLDDNGDYTTITVEDLLAAMRGVFHSATPTLEHGGLHYRFDTPRWSCTFTTTPIAVHLTIEGDRSRLHADRVVEALARQLDSDRNTTHTWRSTDGTRQRQLDPDTGETTSPSLSR